MESSTSKHDKDKARRMEKEKIRNSQKSSAHSQKTKKKLLMYGSVLLIVGVLFIGLIQYQNYSKSKPGKFDAFATCLSEKGAYMYGTDWCSHCQNQKKMFGNSFRLVNFIDCDRSSSACQNAGVTSYPTWIFADGSRESGTQTFKTLADKTSCTP